MKAKLLLITTIFLMTGILSFGQKRSEQVEYMNVIKLLYSKVNGQSSYNLIYPDQDSTGQFVYTNLRDGINDLDGVNVRQLRRSISSFVDTLFIGADTFLTMPPDTFYQEADSTWLHSGQSIKFVNQRDSFYSMRFNEWLRNGDEVDIPDTSYYEWLGGWKGINDTITTPVDSSYYISITGDTITIINGDVFVRNDSTFQIRKDPFCSFCWEYKYSTWTDWELLFCESTPIGRFAISKDLENFFWMEYGSNGLNWVDSLHPKISLADSNKVIMMKPDSTWSWEYLPGDSLFFEDSNEWLLPGDTIPDQRDSLFFENIGWKANRDTIPDKTDSLFIYDGTYYNRGDELIINNNIDTVYSTLTVTDTVYSQIARIDTVYSQISRVDTIYSTIIKTDTIVLNGEGFADEKVKIAYSTGSKSTAGYLSEDDFTLQNVGGVNRFKLKTDSTWIYDTYGMHSKDSAFVGIGKESENGAQLTIGGSNSTDHFLKCKYGANSPVFSIERNGVTYMEGLGIHELPGIQNYLIAINAQDSYSNGQGGLWSYSESGYSGYFFGGLGLKADSLSLTSGSKIGRLGTMATQNYWTGSETEYQNLGSYDANTIYFRYPDETGGGE